MEREKAYRTYLEKVLQGLIEDAAGKNQPIPQNFRIEADDEVGLLFGADYFKYLVYGRPPGKRPPPDTMLAYVQSRPDILISARYVFKNISEKSLAFLIGRSIGEKGSQIYQGKKPGIDFLGVMDAHMNELLTNIAKNEALKIVTGLRNELNR